MRKVVLLLAAVVICSAFAPLALGQTYRPSTYADTGNVTTENPTYAYDGNATTYATLNGVYLNGDSSIDECQWSGFPSHTSAGSLTLNITLAVPFVNHGTVNVFVTVAGQNKASFSYTSAQSETTVQWTVPAGTNLDTISVTAEVFGRAPGGSAVGHIYEIWIQ
jgi:hypothetical protein